MNKDKAKEELQKKIRRNIKLVLKIIALINYGYSGHELFLAKNFVKRSMKIKKKSCK